MLSIETTSQPAGNYVSMAEAGRRLNRSAAWIMRQAIDGKIRTRVERGRTPRYSVRDIEQLLAEGE